MTSPDLAPSPRGGIDRPRERFSFIESSNLNGHREGAPGGGSSLEGAIAGNSDPVRRVHSSTGTY